MPFTLRGKKNNKSASAIVLGFSYKKNEFCSYLNQFCLSCGLRNLKFHILLLFINFGESSSNDEVSKANCEFKVNKFVENY